jgi:molybdenum cofactor synthesis domain-containing protein
MAGVEMLTVGRELLIGRTLNTNALWVGKRLAAMGTMLKRVTTVDDDLGEIADSLRGALRRSPDFLVVVGGLGPTPDDMTLKGIARGLGVGLERSGAALALIKEHYEKRGLGAVELTPARVKMALLPVGGVPVENRVGTAPGVRVRAGDTTVYALPGVPAEMRSIFKRSVEPEVRKRLGELHRKYLTLKVEGVLESEMAPVIAEGLRRHPGAYIKSHPKGIREGVSRLELDIAVVGEDPAKTEAEALRIAGELERAAVAAGGEVGPRREGDPTGGG